VVYRRKQKAEKGHRTPGAEKEKKEKEKRKAGKFNESGRPMSPAELGGRYCVYFLANG
jgi:hypothetical protein